MGGGVLDKIYGMVMSRMAEGVEKSKFVLIAMSGLYQKSQYCRSEALMHTRKNAL